MMRLLGSSLLAMLVVVVSAHAAMDDKSIRERTMPVGTVCVEGDECGSASAAASAGPAGPEDIYAASCKGCHGTGVLNAPKFGDAAAWGARAEKGVDALIANAISGTGGGMPPRGTCGSCSDDDIAATVQYILENSK